MIFEFNQRKRLPKSKYEVTYESRVIAVAETPKFLNGILHADGDYFLQVKKLGKVIAIKNDEQVCEIKPMLEVTKKILFFKQGYDYYIMTFQGERFFVYEVGLGADQHYFCFHRNNETVAIINKADRVINYLDSYKCYTYSNEMLIPISLFCLFLECAAFYDIDAMGNSDRTEIFATRQPELIEKFDKDFISKIKKEDGIID